jgi:ornithine cyclodeaminase
MGKMRARNLAPKFHNRGTAKVLLNVLRDGLTGTALGEPSLQIGLNRELQHGLSLGVIWERSTIIELGKVTSGLVAGRSIPKQTTVCDLTRTGMQDTAIATPSFRRPQERELGMEVESNK